MCVLCGRAAQGHDKSDGGPLTPEYFQRIILGYYIWHYGLTPPPSSLSSLLQLPQKCLLLGLTFVMAQMEREVLVSLTHPSNTVRHQEDLMIRE
ncbi:hypothetical protein RUM44_012264 [Polyplax serrata]|uniref:Uncharacterized protein n=1 Tax=Polyplax serrata TaxID=468196 RepID=A0ABR1BFQ4_POLSC